MIGEVFYKDRLAGQIRETEEGDFVFEYLQEYLKDGGAPLSYSLPVTQKIFQSRQIHGFFDGLLPEGWLLNLAASHWQLNPLRDRYQLLLKTAFDPIGAVSIREKGLPPARVQKRHLGLPVNISFEGFVGKCLYCYESLDLGDYHQSCSRKLFGKPVPPVVDLDQTLLEELERLSIARQLSVPGVQRKISLDLVQDDDRNSRLTLTNFAGRFILKPHGMIPHVPENEDLIMKLARTCGVQAAQTGLLRLADGTLSLITRRMDRADDLTKLHMEDFCQILDQLTLKKYVGSLHRVAKALRNYCLNNAPQDQVLRLFELVVFSHVVGNSDLHLKSVSVLLDPLPRLSPAYDLLSFAIYEEDFEERENLQSALAINGKKNKLTKLDFDRLAEDFEIKPKVRDTIYRKFTSRQPMWFALIEKSFLPDRKKNLLKQLIDQRLNQLKTAP